MNSEIDVYSTNYTPITLEIVLFTLNYSCDYSSSLKFHNDTIKYSKMKYFYANFNINFFKN